MPELTLGEALNELSCGNMDALDSIYRLTQRQVYAVTLSVVQNKSDAEDAMQDTYIKICDGIGTFAKGKNPEAWVCRIARNAAYDIVRKRKPTADYDKLENLLSDPSDPDEELDDRDSLVLILSSAGRCLNSSEREILMLHTVGGMSHFEIAKAVGKPYPSVRWTYANAIGKIKKDLKLKGVVVP